MIRQNSAKLGLLFWKHYNQQLNIPRILKYRRVVLPVSPGEEHSNLVNDFSIGILPNDQQDIELIQVLMDDLCRQGIIKEGDYMIDGV